MDHQNLLSSIFKQTKHHKPLASDAPFKTEAKQNGPSQTSTPTVTKSNPNMTKSMVDVPVVSPLVSGDIKQTEQVSYTPKSPGVDDLDISNWGLYPTVEKWFKDKGMSRMFEWQRDCLMGPGVLNGERNLLFSAPTSAGKTLVADILMMKQVFENRKKVLVILPYVSITREKMTSLQDMLKDTHIRVGGFMGSHHTQGGFDGVDIAICTIEKANNIILRLLHEDNLDKLGGIIVDELHQIGDWSRGYLLELLLTKVMFVCKTKLLKIQIIGMSATLPNLDDLGLWLNSYVYKTDFRPVPLTENIQIGRDILNVKTGQLMDRISERQAEKEEDSVVYLSIKTILEGFACIIFYNDKKGAERLAIRISEKISQVIHGKPGPSKDTIRSNLNKIAIKGILDQLKSCAVREDLTLSRVVSYGVAYHHAGLCMEQREIIEDAFRNGSLKLLVATSTLSSGVNLPARRVIIRSPCGFRNDMMDVLMYKQMIGRAGRKGIDEKGESILLCASNEQKTGWKLVKSQPPPVVSCLMASDDREESSPKLNRAVLEAIVTGLIKNLSQVESYVNCTLMAVVSSSEKRILLQKQHENAIEYLRERNFITVNGGGDFEATQLAKGVVASSLAPEDGLLLLRELCKARKGFVLNCDLHLLYQIIPNSVLRIIKVNVDVMKQMLESFEGQAEYEFYLDVANILDVSLPELYRNPHVDIIDYRIKNHEAYKRFYVALALNEIIQEKPFDLIEEKYQINKGLLQSLQQSTSTFAGMISIFCNKLGWHNLELLISQFQSRLEFGIQRELIDLMRIPLMNAIIARQLYEANIDTVASVAHSTPEILMAALKSGKSFEASSPRRRLQNILWIESKRCTMTFDQITQCLLKESREILEGDLGVSINWNSLNDSSNLSSGHNDTTANVVFHVPTTPKSSRRKNRKSPRKLLVPLKKFARMSKTLRKGRSTSLGEHSISLDQSMTEAADTDDHQDVQPTLDEKRKCQSESVVPSESTVKLSTAPVTSRNTSQTSTGQQMGQEDPSPSCSSQASTSTFSTPVKSSLSSGDGSSTESSSEDNQVCDEPIVPVSIKGTHGLEPKSLFKPSDRIQLTPSKKRPAAESPTLCLMRHQNKIQKNSTPDKIGSSQSDPTLPLETPPSSQSSPTKRLEMQMIGSEDFKKITPDSKLNKIDVTSETVMQQMIELWTSKKCCSVVCDTKSFVGKKDVIGSKITKASATVSSKDTIPESTALSFCMENTVLNRMLFCFGDEDVYCVSGKDLLNQLSVSIQHILTESQGKLMVVVYNVINVYRVFRECLMIPHELLFQKISWFDTRIVHWLMDPESGSNMNINDLVKVYLPSFSRVSHAKRASLKYPTAFLLPLMSVLKQELMEQKMLQVFEDLEVPASLVLGEMVSTGIGVDKDVLNETKDQLVEMRGKLIKRSQELAGVKFNIDSPKQISKILSDKKLISKMYEMIDTNPLRVEKLKRNNQLPDHLKTNKDVLEKLRKHDPFPGVIMDYRTVNAAIKKSIDPLIHYTTYDSRHNMNRVTGKIDTLLATGRVAMDHPNLLCIQNNFRVEHESTDFKIRSCLIPKDGWSFVSADYSQLELRIMAHFSSDPVLMAALNNGGDVFKSVASSIFDKNIEEITLDERKQAKGICYGIIYGMGSRELAKRLAITEDEAKEFRDIFMATFPGIQEFLESCINSCREKGYIKTIGGRIRLLPEINTTGDDKSRAKRQAVNSTIQGSAADLIKVAMIRLNQVIINRRLESGLRLVLEMHDELIYEVRDDLVQEFSLILSQVMTSLSNVNRDPVDSGVMMNDSLQFDLRVVLPVNLKVGKNWSDMSDYFI